MFFICRPRLWSALLAQNWNYCFMISSSSVLNEIFYRATNLNIPIYYSNTDSLVLPSEKVAMLGTILDCELGQFKIERGNIHKFICISAEKYLKITPEETRVVSFHKDSPSLLRSSSLIRIITDGSSGGRLSLARSVSGRFGTWLKVSSDK